MKLKLTPILLLSTILLSGCANLPFIGKKQSALQVNSTPGASVYVNGDHKGQTPFYDDKFKPGQYTVRILVDNDPAKDWQTQVNLNPSVVTVVNRQFGNTPEESSSYTLILEPIGKQDSGQLEVTTVPENVIVKVDGRPEGFSPLKLENVTSGDHSVNLTAPGYQELSFTTQVQNGYKVVATSQLARSTDIMEGSEIDTATASAAVATPSGQSPLGGASASPKTTPTVTPKVSPTPKVTSKLTPTTPAGSPTPTKKAATGTSIEPPYITVKETGTGWLRVRSEPEVGDNEVAKIDVGEKFPYLDKTDDGWYKIEYETGKEGWVVSRYADLTE